MNMGMSIRFQKLGLGLKTLQMVRHISKDIQMYGEISVIPCHLVKITLFRLRLNTDIRNNMFQWLQVL